jgi:hypothetical protein
VKRADRILAMATERGPLGVRQYDFDYPARDRGSAIPAISTVIASEKLDLVLVHGNEGPVFYLPIFVPEEFFRTGWGCLHRCGAGHTANWVEDHGPFCGNCGGDGLIQIRIVRHREPETAGATA